MMTFPKGAGIREFLARFVGLFAKRKREMDLQDEIRAHLDALVDENMRRGMSAEDARHAAMRDFGGVEQSKEAYRDQRSLPLVEVLVQDLRFALRGIRTSLYFRLLTLRVLMPDD